MRKSTSWKKNQRHSLNEWINVDLLKYEDDANRADFIDKIYSTSLILQITSPTKITPPWKTLVDNIFFNRCRNFFSNMVTSVSVLSCTIS